MKLQSQSKPVTKSTFKPSPFQQAGFDWGDSNIGKYKAAVMIAVAGSGKSTFLREFYTRMSNKYDRMLLLAFNSNNAKEARDKNTVSNCTIITYHAYGNSAIRKLYKPTLDTEGKKVEMIIKGRLADNQRFLIPPIKRIVSLCKANVVINPTDDDLNYITAMYDIDFGDNTPDEMISKAFDLVRHGLSESINMVDKVIDFDDMIYIPVVLGLQPDQYGLIMADEFQDTNKAQAKLIQMGRTANMIGVGDPWQSIYAFRGADSKAMENLTVEFEADTLPLSISYRCPKAVGDLVRSEFPNIDFQTPDWAKEGSITTTEIEKAIPNMQEGDLVVSRVNAALPKLAFTLIRQGKTARIMGRDIGRALKEVIVKQKATSTSDLWGKLNSYKMKQVEKFTRMNMQTKVQQIDDQIETIMALAEGTNSVYDLITRCDTMFSDEQIGISLGTVHKNKGREANNVFIVRPDLLPLPFVMEKGNAEAKQQELNMRYVAETRPLENLIFATGELK